VRERTAALTAAIDALRREVAERKRAEEARDEFLSVAAHELKTPLTSLRGFAQLLASSLGSGSPPNVERLTTGLQAIERQSEKLSWLVTQLLDVSRLEAGRLVLERRPTDVVPLVNQVLEAARAGSQHHALRLRAPESAVVAVDPLRLEQVLTNLVDNAIKYSPEGGPVDVEVALGRLMLRIDVADQGLGIPAEHRPRIFDRFYRAHPEQRIGGLGLGLYISRQIVELHGGAIKVEQPESGGTRMVVWVPVAPVEA
jgi:signal transduction histidine kinase